jgi:hypothetical protein
MVMKSRAGAALALWRLLRRWEKDENATDEEQAELLALKACAASHLQDFRRRRSSWRKLSPSLLPK